MSRLSGGATTLRAVPTSRPTASFWLDESGAKNTAAQCYVVAGIKTRHPDEIDREIQAVRDRHGYLDELKFGRLTQRTLPIFLDLVAVLERSDARLVATVVNSGANPFHGSTVWDAYTNVVSQLVVGNINRGELGCVFVDRITTPPEVNLGELIKRRANERLGGGPVVLATSLNSKASDLLQAADMCAGAIRTLRLDSTEKPDKVRVARQLAVAFDADGLADVSSGRVSIETLRTTGRRRRASRSVVGVER